MTATSGKVSAMTRHDGLLRQQATYELHFWQRASIMQPDHCLL
jgi:hypothetical protein